MEFRADSRTACVNTGILEKRLCLGDRHRALLAIRSFIITELAMGEAQEGIRNKQSVRLLRVVRDSYEARICATEARSPVG